MKIPSGMTEDQVIKTIDKSIKGLCSKFKFGYFEKEDLEQEGWVFALEALENYDNKRPLENFLRVHIRNRFMSLKRNKFYRYQPPCLECPFYDPKNLKSKNQCAEFLNKDECDKLTAWKKRNESKYNLMKPKDIQNISNEPEVEFGLVESINLESVKRKINDALPVELRGDFLRMLDGVYISKQRKDRVRDFIKEMGILDEDGNIE